MVKRLDGINIFTEQCLINGQWVDLTDVPENKSIPVKNPATNEEIAEVPSLTAQQVEAAIVAAQAAFPVWRKQAAKERGKLLHAWADAMREAQEELAVIMVLEQGKPLSEAKGEVDYAADYIQWFAEEAVRLYGDVIPAPASDQTILVEKEPVGVCACITPWNFPIAMLARKVGAALAAGCTVVAKPSSLTPLSALAFAKIADNVGLPPGVLNVITGPSADIGDQLCKDPRINKISFTGSTEVGRELAQKCAPDFKKLSLELGGNAPFIVFDDADLDLAVEGLIAAKFRNNGQTCVCVNRLFVQDSIYESFVIKLEEAMRKLKIGDAFSEETEQTVLINSAALDKFNRHVNDALSMGGKLVMGGEAENQVAKPTLIKNGNVEMQHCQEETFAPLLVAIPFATEQEAVAAANETPYGLAAYFYAKNFARIRRVSRELQAGMVGVNAAAISNVAAPFGGIKHSGYGREGSKYGMDDYTQIKYILLSE